MTVERHYDDEVLMSMVGNEAAQAAARRQHLADCLSCTETLESYRTLADCLGEEALWDMRELPDEPVPQTIATLRAFASEMDREGAQAENILRELLAGSRESWMPRLQQHPEWRTAGVVRKLIAATDRAIDTMPPDAVAITALATEIADHLPPAFYASDTVLKLRGAAWRERAYAQFFVGRFFDAADAIQLSATHFSSCVVEEYEMARVLFMRAQILREVEQFGDAAEAGDQSASLFVSYGDQTKASQVAVTVGAILYRERHFKEALETWLKAESELVAAKDVIGAATVLQNIAFCHRELGQMDLATDAFERASKLYQDAGNLPAVLRSWWYIARTKMSQQRYAEALECFIDVRNEFDRLEMRADVALVDLEIAEIELLLSRNDRVVQLCSAVVKYYEVEGLTHSQAARTAVAYLSEMAAARRATPNLAREVRMYVEQVKKQPTLAFAFLPR